MPVWKCDLVFEAQGRGWQETYYKDWPGTGFASAQTIMTNLANKRIAMCGKPVQIKAYRISDPLVLGNQGQPVYFNPVKAAPTGEADPGASDPATAILSAWRVDAGTAGRLLWLRGVWDGAITDFGQLNSNDYASWHAKFIAWRDYVLEKGFGWMKSQRSGPSVPVTYSISADPVMPVFTFPAGFLEGVSDGAAFRVRFSKFNGSSSPLNRELVVVKTNATTATVAAPIATGAMISPGRAIRYTAPQFQAADAIIVNRTGRRAPGAPLLLTPGRGRNRPRV